MRVFLPYFGMLERLRITSTYSGGNGTERTRLCAIPQGCPMSMATMALAMVPWVRLMKEQTLR
eukprot:10924994-Alexandrium_andersonii.AAC.1